MPEPPHVCARGELIFARKRKIFLWCFSRFGFGVCFRVLGGRFRRIWGLGVFSRCAAIHFARSAIFVLVLFPLFFWNGAEQNGRFPPYRAADADDIFFLSSSTGCAYVMLRIFSANVTCRYSCLLAAWWA